jgi:hypothetical protein
MQEQSDKPRALAIFTRSVVVVVERGLHCPEPQEDDLYLEDQAAAAAVHPISLLAQVVLAAKAILEARVWILGFPAQAAAAAGRDLLAQMRDQPLVETVEVVAQVR